MAMRYRRINWRQLAALADMNQGTLYRVLRTENVKLWSLQRLAVALNCTVGYLTDKSQRKGAKRHERLRGPEDLPRGK